LLDAGEARYLKFGLPVNRGLY